jgi:hypothetical protein
LLGTAGVREPSPFFVRNVLREVRGAGTRRGISSWFSFRRLAPAAGAFALLIAGAVAFHPLHLSRGTATATTARAELDEDVAADIDDLVGADDETDDTSIR